jgi:hypothetical protein
MSAPQQTKPAIQELWNSRVNISGCTIQYPETTVPLLTRAVSVKKQPDIRNKDNLIRLDDLEHMELVLKNCQNIDAFTTTPEILVWMTLVGYYVPLTTETSTVSSLQMSAKASTKQLKFKITPVLNFQAANTQEYSHYVAEYFYQRFPNRTRKICKKLLSNTQISTETDWIQRAIQLYIADDGHSVIPSIFSANPNTALIVPPLHTLSEINQAAIGAQLSPNTPHYQGLKVLDPKYPMKCATCEKQQCWQFAYKHCGCTKTFTSCFQCALQEWYRASRTAAVTLTHNPNILLVTCQHCQEGWSLFGLLHVQGSRNWFESHV